MVKQKVYRRTRFPPNVIRDAAAMIERSAEREDRVCPQDPRLFVAIHGALWTHDSEAEFFADYRESTGDAVYEKRIGRFGLEVLVVKNMSVIEVRAPTRELIQQVFEVFELSAPSALQPEPPAAPPPAISIFIGHRRSPLWKDLKDHLHEKHDYRVVAYEIGARAGHTIRDVLGEMLKDSSLALLVMTGEDELADGRIHPRLNVVHEAGLFQGYIGFSRAVILLEDGTEEFSNIQGIQQIRFSKGNIRETFGEILATIRREFPGPAIRPNPAELDPMTSVIMTKARMPLP